MTFPRAGGGGNSRPGFAGGGRAGLGDRPGIGDGRLATLPALGLGSRAGTGDRLGVADGPRGDRFDNRQDLRGDRFDNRQDWMKDRQDNRGDRRDNLQDRLENRDDRWQDWQDDRHDRWDDIADDWHDWHNWHDHGDWDHGYWHGNWGNWWYHLWDDYPAAMALGLTGWGVNRWNYWSGYSPYYNPYYAEPYAVGNSSIDYSQPLTVYEQAAYEAPVETAAVQAFDAARQAFHKGDYAAALDDVNRALAITPDDAALHEFRSLVMFATGKYRDAAAGLHAVLAVGPGWDWTTLSQFYPGVDVYKQQLRALESHIIQNPTAADASFLLAYHYLTAGHTDASAWQLKQVLQNQPRDEVARQLLQMIAGPEALADLKAGAPASPEIEDDPSVDINSADLVGTWSAKAPDGGSITMNLAKDGVFQWTYRDPKTKETKIAGVYALEGNQLALQPDAGGAILAGITAPQGGSFRFQVVGGPQSDAGLQFQKGGNAMRTPSSATVAA